MSIKVGVIDVTLSSTYNVLETIWSIVLSSDYTTTYLVIISADIKTDC